MQNNAVNPNHANASSLYAHQAEPEWLEAAVKSGFSGDSLSREDCLAIRKNTNAKLPRWLMKDPMRRIGRGMYAIPELSAYAAQKSKANA